MHQWKEDSKGKTHKLEKDLGFSVQSGTQWKQKEKVKLKPLKIVLEASTFQMLF